MFDRIRNWDKNPSVYPDALGRFKISGIRDLYTGFDTREDDKIAVCNVFESCFDGFRNCPCRSQVI